MSNSPYDATDRFPLRTQPNLRAFAFSREDSATRLAKDTGTAGTSDAYPIISFCHLSWDWVWQRPQQFLSRLARKRPLLFVETYAREIAESQFATRRPEGHASVTILQMSLPSSHWHDGVFIDRERRRLLKAYLESPEGAIFQRPVLWFNDPMAATAFLGHFKERAVVYDCMDELSQFKGAPPEILVRERKLLLAADVVFCGGRKMREKRLSLNANTHFYGTGVDCVHFGGALLDGLEIAPEIAAFGKNVLGYFGVVDERLDYELIAKLAESRNDWQIVIVGPTAKIDPSRLPQRSNLHWIGARPYSELPSIAKGFSVCLMPFALNAATEYINPTKALEYMASGKPVVSTALDEVRTNFGSVARIGRSHEEFISLVNAEMEKPSASRINRGLALAAANTWEVIVAKMEKHVADALGSRDAEALESAASKSVRIPVPRPAYV